MKRILYYYLGDKEDKEYELSKPEWQARYKVEQKALEFDDQIDSSDEEEEESDNDINVPTAKVKIEILIVGDRKTKNDNQIYCIDIQQEGGNLKDFYEEVESLRQDLRDIRDVPEEEIQNLLRRW